jgi:serine/threonine-protein kinase
MATFEKPKPPTNVPIDLLPVIRASGILTEVQLAEIKAKILRGDLPIGTLELAEALVKEGLLSDYQARRFLSNKPHGLVVGRYIIMDRLGSGSMGRVYKAHHRMMDRFVALKIIAPEIVTNERVVARFQREMKLVGRLDHPNVIRAFDADQMGRLLYIVMEYVQGTSLGAMLRQGTIPPLDMAEFGSQAALGLAHAHAQGIVHRDVKPSNLLLTTDRQLKVLDLGLGVLMETDDANSFATADGIAVGTVDYMSPEQACGRDVDGRSDLFSLGCCMYHLISGRLPFPGNNPIDRMGKRITGKHVPISEVKPSTPAPLVKVLDKLLANKPQDRFQNALEASEALRSVTKPKAKPAPPPVPVEPSVDRTAAPKAGPALETVIVRIPPDYPAWFRPLASLVETRPRTTLGILIAAVVLWFGGGFLLGRLLR